jgi:hypothetical protein
MFEEVKMRTMSLLIAGIALASCSTAPPGPPPPPSPKAQMEFARVTQGKVPGPPISCLQHYDTNEQTTIDSHTLAMRPSSSTTYIVHLTDGCEMLDNGPYALLSRQHGGLGLCRGDIQSVVDTLNRSNVGSCTIAEIIPYTRR